MKEHLWTGLSLVTPLEARVIGRPPSGVDGVSIDTRTLEQGDLFFAIKGHNSDGHAFVAKAFAMGAAACVVDEAHVDYLDADGPLYVVRDTLKAMEGLGRAARARSNAWIAAITGSVGKTSTKEMLRLTLDAFGPTHASAASYNNHWGVPLTLARMPQAAEFGVFEIGMNHAGEITPLVGMVRPQVAVITAIAPVHLENLGSLEAIADAKAEIFSGLAPDGVAVINRDAPYFDRLLEAARAANARRILTFGEHQQADARLIHARRRDQSNMVDAEVLGRRLDYRIAAPGKHVALNSLAVLLVADAMGVAIADAAQTFTQFSAPAGRGAQTRLRIPGGEVLLIDEAYNANPVSMRAALEVLAASPIGEGGRRIAVLGDMLELGPDEARLHRDLADVTMACGVDLVFASGPLMKHMYEALAPSRRGLWTPSSAGLQAELPAAIRPGDAVMVKGSNGSKMSAVVAALRALAASQKSETSSC